MKIAVYCVSDENYIKPSIVALKSFKVTNPEVDLFIVSDAVDKIEERVKKTLLDENIEILDPKFRGKFKKSQKWPEEVFWVLGIPEILYEKGYNYSITIDADILCKKNMDLKNLTKNIEFVGAIKDELELGQMLNDKEFLNEEYGLKTSDYNMESPNTGFMIYNNRYCHENKIFEKHCNLFNNLEKKNSIENVFADQGLLGLLIKVYNLSFYQLDRSYNFMVHEYDAYKYINSDIKFIHYTSGMKPWHSLKLGYIRRNPTLYYFRKDWNKFVDEYTGFNRDLSYKDEKNKKNEYKIKDILDIPLESLVMNVWLPFWIKKHEKRGNL